MLGSALALQVFVSSESASILHRAVQDSTHALVQAVLVLWWP